MCLHFLFQLVAVLREAKYLLIRSAEEIPPSVQTMYAKNDIFLKYVANLDLIALWYNKVRKTVLEVEYPIIENQLDDIDRLLLRAEKELSWNSEGINL